MAALRSRVKTTGLLSFLLGIQTAGVCRADDCGPAAYAYDQRVVFYRCDKSGALVLHVVVLEDAKDLKVAGLLPVTEKRSYDTIFHYKDLVLILTWDHLRIYDTADPAHPSLAASFSMKTQGSFRGYARIEKSGESTFLVLSSLGAGELTVAGDPSQWTFKDIARTPAHDKIMSQWPSESRFSRQIQDVVPVQETGDFRYELVWRSKKRVGEATHGQYLRKVDKASQRTVSELALGGQIETID